MGKRIIIKVPAKVSYAQNGIKKVRTVAAYARVSTHRDEQENSLAAQKDYFIKYVGNHPGWVLYNMYIDEGISGTRSEHRKGFNLMLEDAYTGKFDLIITKSVSRFARNTVDTLTTIRKLKEHGVEIFFEKENIYTFDSKGEFLITLLGSLAQEESRSISENIKWGMRAAFARGQYWMHPKTFLGYDRKEKCEYIINENQAVIVRLIFHLSFMGETAIQIAKLLDDLNVPRVMPTSKRWRSSTVYNILCNERYKGDALLQKKFVPDFLTKKSQINTGELPQYYVTDGHPAIIPRDTFDFLQQMLVERKRYGTLYSAKQGDHCILVCEKCNCLYGRKNAHSNDKYQKYFLRCNGFYKNRCKMPTMDERRFYEVFYSSVQKWIYLQRSRIEKILSEISTLFGNALSAQIKEVLEHGAELMFDKITCKVLVQKIIVSQNDVLNFYFIDGSQLAVDNSAAIKGNYKK